METRTAVYAQIQGLTRELIAAIQPNTILPTGQQDSGDIDLCLLTTLSYGDLKDCQRPVLFLSEMCRLLVKVGDKPALEQCLALSHVMYAFKCQRNESWYLSYLYKGCAQIGLHNTNLGIKNVALGLTGPPAFPMAALDQAVGYWALLSAAIAQGNLRLARQFLAQWEQNAQDGQLVEEIWRVRIVQQIFALLYGERETSRENLQRLLRDSSPDWQPVIAYLASWTQAQINTGSPASVLAEKAGWKPTILQSIVEPSPLLLGIEWCPQSPAACEIASQSGILSLSKGLAMTDFLDDDCHGEESATKQSLSVNFRVLCAVRRRWDDAAWRNKCTPEELERCADMLALWKLPGPLVACELALQQRDAQRYMQHRLTRLFGQPVQARVLAETQQDAEIALRPEALIWVMDVRKYSALSETCTPEQLFTLLNPVFKIMHAELERIGGAILEFVGDCIIVVFNVFPGRQTTIIEIVTHTTHCLERLRVLNALSRQSGLPEMQTGVGIHRGPVALGYLGGLERCHLTILGNAMNLAARIETASKNLPGEIIVSAACFDTSPGQIWTDPLNVRVALRDLGLYHQMKNISQPLHLFGISPLLRYWVDFVPMGFAARSEPGVVYLDAGNAVLPGIIDHHCPQANAHSSCEFLIRQPELLIAHLRDTPASQREFRFHDPPDLDCAAAFYAACELLDHLPRQPVLDKLADYLHLVNHARIPKPERLSVSLYGVYKMHELLVKRHYGERLTNQFLLQAGVRVVNAACYLLEQHPEGDLADIFHYQPDWFAQEQQLIAADYQTYQEDLKARSHVYFARVNGKPDPVPGVWLNQPQSLFFRIHAWNDPYAPGGQGYTVIALETASDGKRRIVIGVNPDAGTHLNGLGQALEAQETAKRQQLGKERPAETDPWYSGQGHEYGMVASPGEGTVLTAAEVQHIHERWPGQDFVDKT